MKLGCSSVLFNQWTFMVHYSTFLGRYEGAELAIMAATAGTLN